MSDERVAGNGGAILTISILVTRGLLVANQVALVIPGAATLAVLFALVEWEPLIDAGLVLVVPLADRKPGEPQWADLQATARLENRMLTVGPSGDPATNQAITLIRTGFADPSLGRGDEIRQAAQEVNQGSSSIAVRAITILGFINVLHQVGLGLHACVRNPNALDFASLSEAHDQVLPMILGERGGPAEYFLADSHDRFSYLPKLLSLAVPDINPRVSDLVKLHRAGGLQYLREAVEDAIYHIRLLDERLLFDRGDAGASGCLGQSQPYRRSDDQPDEGPGRHCRYGGGRYPDRSRRRRTWGSRPRSARGSRRRGPRVRWDGARRRGRRMAWRPPIERRTCFSQDRAYSLSCRHLNRLTAVIEYRHLCRSADPYRVGVPKPVILW